MSLSLSRIISVIAFWGGEGDRFWDVGGAIAFGMWEVRSLLGMWECDRFWGVGGRSLFGDMRSLVIMLELLSLKFNYIYGI